jgi:hypothetical protein
MLDANAIALAGAAGAAGAAVAGFKVVRAHLDLAWHEGPGAAIRRLYDEAIAEPVPEDMTETLAKLDGDEPAP